MTDKSGSFFKLIAITSAAMVLISGLFVPQAAEANTTAVVSSSITVAATTTELTSAVKPVRRQVHNPRRCELQLPSGRKDHPTEVRWPAVAKYSSPWFVRWARSISFRAPVTGVTTPNSEYPRTECREMLLNGRNAAWSSTSGRHTLFLNQAVTALPKQKSQMVIGQIHDKDEYVAGFRVQADKLYLNVHGDNYLLDGNYKLKERFTVQFVVTGGVTYFYYNGKLVRKLKERYSGAYFKYGAYLQSNCKIETKRYCNSRNIGAVLVYRAIIRHRR